MISIKKMTTHGVFAKINAADFDVEGCTHM